MTTSKKPTFITPPNTLKQKVGDGGIPAYLIKQSQEFMESNAIDFAPYATKYLQDLKDIRKQFDDKKLYEEIAMPQIVNIIMQLKSNGSMFHYQLISMVSDVLLRFLEKAKRLDKDFFEILGVYMAVLEIILNKKLQGNGGREGHTLTQELHNACLRYYTKHKIP